ncbi:hypothetical protein [Myroides odoratimimus]|uniref:hypothetical protein n=1 Tax=Myroides odoratimimus TaxID=76832 RepID=UPI00310134C2
MLNQGGIKYKFEIERYSRSFKEFAKKDFFSFDRTVVGDSNNNEYHLVAYPKKYDFFKTMFTDKLVYLIFIKNHLKSILDSRKYIQDVKDILRNREFINHRFQIIFYYGQIIYLFFNKTENIELKETFYELLVDCLNTYINIELEADINQMMDKVKILHDSFEFIIQLSEKQIEGDGRLSDWLYREVMLVNNLYSIES